MLDFFHIISWPALLFTERLSLQTYSIINNIQLNTSVILLPSFHCIAIFDGFLAYFGKYF